MKKIKHFMLQIVAAALLICLAAGMAACGDITKIKLNKDEIEMFVGDEYKLEVTVDGEDGERTWTSTDESIATVDKDGNVKALKNGIAIITVKLGNSDDSCTVDVSDKKTVTEAEWKAAMKSTSYTIKDVYSKDGAGNVVKLVGVTEEDIGMVSYTESNSDKEVVFSMTGGRLFKYENNAWSEAQYSDETFEKVGEIAGSFPLSALAESFSSFAYDDVLEYYGSDNVTITYDRDSYELELAMIRFLNGKLNNAQYYVNDKPRFVSAVGTTVIDVPALNPADVPADPLAEAISDSILIDSVTMETGMMADGVFVPSITVKTSGEWMSIAITANRVSEGGETTTVPFFYFYKTTENGVLYWISENGATISGEGKTFDDPEADPTIVAEIAGDYAAGIAANYGHIIFGSYTSEFSYDEATGAYTAASITVPSVDPTTQEPTTQEFKNVKIVVANGLVFSMEYTLNQSGIDVVFKYSDYGVTVAEPIELSATTEIPEE